MSENWALLLDEIKTEIDKSCPLRHFKIKKEKEPWITPDLIELIKDKDKALKTAKKKRNVPMLWTEEKSLRKNCTRRLRQARADFISENLNNNIGNQKEFWKNIQNILPNKKSGNPDIHLIHDTLNIEIDDKQTSTYINDFFINIGPKLVTKCKTPWN